MIGPLALPSYNAISQKWFLSAMQSLKYMSLFHISASRSLYFPCVHNEYTKYTYCMKFIFCLFKMFILVYYYYVDCWSFPKFIGKILLYLKPTLKKKMTQDMTFFVYYIFWLKKKTCLYVCKYSLLPII